MLQRAFLLAALAVLPAHAQQAHDHAASGQPAAKSDPAYAKFSEDMKAGMDRMMRDMHAPGRAGNADIDFLAMMIPHHEGAVEMARLLLIHGRDPATRRLAEDIIASQVVEIEGMKRRLAILRAGGKSDPAEFPALGGTRGPAK
jgi:uncharacterized protein (DUF305 family)